MSKNQNVFEFNPVKMGVRMDLMQQQVELSQHLKKKKLLANGMIFCTLPGEHWSFETMLNHRLRNIGVNAKFVCAENKEDTFYYANKIKPKDTQIIYMCEAIETAIKAGKGVFHSIWADYCGFATTERVKCLVQAMVDSNNTVGYGTFYANGRKHAKKPKTILKNSKSKDYVTAIEEEFEFWFRHFKIKKKIKLIYKNVYSNGQGNRMLTIGFARVGVPIKSIIHKVKIIKKPNNKSPHGDAIRAEFERLGKEYGFTRKTILEIDKPHVNKLIAENLGLSRGKVGATMAHYLNPDSFRK